MNQLKLINPMSDNVYYKTELEKVNSGLARE